MSLSREAMEKYSLFIPWLNENPYHDRSIPWKDRGLKDGAPEEARSAYADFLAMEERCRLTGTKI